MSESERQRRRWERELRKLEQEPFLTEEEARRYIALCGLLRI